ncbi:phage integrase family protein [Paraburkholderia sp. BL18I3N2]|uniref:tyrosine-type recombinase/integrase n=1 Tax=Paraburkholderia sp. BL18I3N2 TaxID=1938799 RepID=UPI000D07AC77|nr:tyrosine-type recombinase/integrase [Paraburkholderia sp. BL18I3N2]PRX33322.1 phage integrase family protein [Paraburkholderia sp. BL18I3N2]
MAWLEYISYQFTEHSLDVNNDLMEASTQRAPIEDLPQIFWEDGTPWDEANVWGLERATSSGLDIETVHRTMKHLCSYANYLEGANLDWRHFPVRKDERVLTKFKGYLIKERDDGIIADSTASACMSAAIMFYRFADLHDMVGAVGPMWVEKSVNIAINDRLGFKRALVRITTDLKIKNTKRVEGVRLEEGLLPLLAADMMQLLAYCADKCTLELHMMLSVGFFTGARVGTVVTLTVTSLYTARESPEWPGVFLLPVGPGTGVSTKLSVKGNILVPRALLNDLKIYATSPTRLKREVKADSTSKDVLFLTRSGRPYSVADVGALVRALRTEATAEGMHFMERFKFHDSRATFGTSLTSILLAHLNPAEALGIVRDALLHKDERTTFDYIRFRERSDAKEQVATDYHEAFTGFRHRDWNKLDA